MKRIYITAIPLDSNFAITPYAAEPVNYTQTTTQPTCYPITPILADTAHDGDEIKVIAVRQVNSHTVRTWRFSAVSWTAWASPTPS